METLNERLIALPEKRYRFNEMFSIIHDFLLAPSIAQLIENGNKIFKIKKCRSENGYIYSLKLLYERDRRTGFWHWFKYTFYPYPIGVKIWHNGQLFVCEYYKHSFFSFCDKVKLEYDEKLKKDFGCDFVMVSRA